MLRSNIRAFASAVLCGLLCGGLAYAADLSRYRDFQIGMDLPTVARHARADPSQAKVIHQRPVLIQELEWQPEMFEASPNAEAVKGVVFTFYNGELFRIAVTYDRYRTEGMSADDLIGGISATYGSAIKPEPAGKRVPSAYDPDSETSVAQWEDAQYSLKLIRSPYQLGYGLIAVSKRLDSLAQTAIVEAARLDVQEAPQREAERLMRDAQQEHAEQAKARLANKPNFRP